jgi:hypothetical protein
MQQPPTPTDADILQAVRQRLGEDLRVDATSIDIVVADGAVTLSGTVPEANQSAVVEADVREVAGVQSIDNQLGPPPEHHFEGEMLPANTVERAEIQQGMRVVGVEGGHVGTVKSVGTQEFLVDRPMARDVWVPLSAVVDTANEYEAVVGGPVQPSQVVLSVRASEVDDQDWRNP